ncbi:hypothetical protein [Acanthopleuribacter pedis]|uniref:Uncharacterized protein n=1 Tax=Acanthopleuribacter pedis TaxID=442870 RepID=A0A8J7U2B3_9BACT|nr:hypothetical protein [Acanthopleuribacter pedis]MBO1318422.1 hypothetical protein [Acanthopleuribacter pedis]
MTHLDRSSFRGTFFSRIFGAVLLLVLITTAGGWVSAAEKNVDPAGYLYAEVTMISGGNYRGAMRWGREEAFWGDHFNSRKEQLPFLKHMPEKRSPGKRSFACRFGDIEQIIVNGTEDAIVHMKSGSMFQVRGYANDVGSKLRIWDEEQGEIEMRWMEIAKIEFIPSETKKKAFHQKRLYGVVSTDQGDLEGYIQWDLEECLHTDELNGEVQGKDKDLKMGEISVIERKDPGVTITLKDGVTFDMYGTNDVNSENRGIMVENATFGRVRISWSRFKKVTFQDVNHTGPSFDTFEHQGKLNGTVTLKNGTTSTGNIVFNMDANEQWAFLNAGNKGMHYTIPLGLVKTLEPRDDRRCLVILHDGTKLTFSEGHDIDHRNLGLLIMTNDQANPEYVAWNDIKTVEFAK